MSSRKPQVTEHADFVSLQPDLEERIVLAAIQCSEFRNLLCKRLWSRQLRQQLGIRGIITPYLLGATIAQQCDVTKASSHVPVRHSWLIRRLKNKNTGVPGEEASGLLGELDCSSFRTLRSEISCVRKKFRGNCAVARLSLWVQPLFSTVEVFYERCTHKGLAIDVDGIVKSDSAPSTRLIALSGEGNRLNSWSFLIVT